MPDDKPAPHRGTRAGSVALLCLATASAGIGIATFWTGKALQGPPFEMSPWPAVLGVLLAVAALVVGGRSLRKQGKFEDEGGRASRWPGTGERRGPGRGARFLALLSAILLTSLVLWLLPGLTPEASHRLVTWWWGGMLLGGFLTESPPSSQRLITVAVPVCFFLAEAMRQMIRLRSAVFGKGCPRWLANGLLVGGIVVFAVTRVKHYFVEYLPLRIYGGSNAELATEIAPRLRSLQSDHEIHFVGPPYMYWRFATLPYLMPNASARDIREPMHGPTDVEAIGMSTTKGAVSVFTRCVPMNTSMSRQLIPGDFTKGSFRLWTAVS